MRVVMIRVGRQPPTVKGEVMAHATTHASRALTALSVLLASFGPQAAFCAGATGIDAASQGPDSVEGFKGHDYSMVAQFHRRHGLRRPSSGVTQAADGLFYGVTADFEKRVNLGGVYRTNESGDITILHAFQGTSEDPGYPQGELVQASDGNLYGLTLTSLYRVSPSGDYAVVHLFDPAREGWDFLSGPVQGANGLLYLVARDGSLHNRGGILTSTLDGSVQVLHAFKEGRDGFAPQAGLALGDDGNLYGTTTQGGALERGTFYRISLDGSFELLATIDPTMCKGPRTRLVLYNGDFYGVCPGGGSHASGSIVRFTQQGVAEKLHDFGRGEDGGQPWGGLVVDPSTGELFGTTLGGGTAEYGTVFEISFDGTEYKKLLDFDLPRSVYPQGDLLLSQDGFIYGTSSQGGRKGGGTVYRFHP